MLITEQLIKELTALKLLDPELYAFTIKHLSPRTDTSFLKGIKLPAGEGEVVVLRSYFNFIRRYRGPRRTFFAGHCVRADAVSVALYLKTV